MKKNFEVLTKVKEVVMDDVPVVAPIPKSLPYHFVVKSLFGKYKKGDRIFSETEINAITGTSSESSCLRVKNNAA